MSDDVKAMRERSRAVWTTKVTDSGAFMAHVAYERVFDLISG